MYFCVDIFALDSWVSYSSHSEYCLFFINGCIPCTLHIDKLLYTLCFMYNINVDGVVRASYSVFPKLDYLERILNEIPFVNSFSIFLHTLSFKLQIKNHQCIDVVPDEFICTVNWLHYLDYEPIACTSSSCHLVRTRNDLEQTVTSYVWCNVIPPVVPFFRLFSERFTTDRLSYQR